jgi:hypothetical protein
VWPSVGVPRALKPFRFASREHYAGPAGIAREGLGGSAGARWAALAEHYTGGRIGLVPQAIRLQDVPSGYAWKMDRKASPCQAQTSRPVGRGSNGGARKAPRRSPATLYRCSAGSPGSG